MTDSRLTEVAHNPDILNEGWNQPFRTVGVEAILKGIQLDFRYHNSAVTLSTEPPPANVVPIEGNRLETAKVNLTIDIMMTKGKRFTTHIQTPDKTTHKGFPRRSKDGNVIGFSGWVDAVGQTPDGKVIYSKKPKPLDITALALQNSMIIISESPLTNIASS